MKENHFFKVMNNTSLRYVMYLKSYGAYSVNNAVRVPLAQIVLKSHYTSFLLVSSRVGKRLAYIIQNVANRAAIIDQPLSAVPGFITCFLGFSHRTWPITVYSPTYSVRY